MTFSASRPERTFRSPPPSVPKFQLNALTLTPHCAGAVAVAGVPSGSVVVYEYPPWWISQLDTAGLTSGVPTISRPALAVRLPPPAGKLKTRPEVEELTAMP